MRRAWIVPACFDAVGVAAALVLVAFERLIDYFASNPRRRRVLGTETGVDVVRALLRGQDPDA